MAEESRPRSRKGRPRPHQGLVEELFAQIPETSDKSKSRLVGELVETALSLLEDDTTIGDVKLVNASTRELRHALRVFDEWEGVPKVTTFGSARLPPGDPVYAQAERFAHRMAELGYMVITGAGPGVMEACQRGAGRERSFGLNIRLPFEQAPNEIIAGDRKSLTFRYFFTRKLMFLKETNAVVLFPGGFGTFDEAFESLTLVQTGKAPLAPVVFVDQPGGTYWTEWFAWFDTHVVQRGLVSGEDFHLFHVTDDVDEAVDEITGFYRAYHSQRYLGDQLSIRLRQRPADDVVERIRSEFVDIGAGDVRVTGVLPEEEPAVAPELPRLVFTFDRRQFGRLRQLVDLLNGAVRR